MNNQKGFANIVLIVLVVVLAGALGYVTLVKKPAPSTIPTTSEKYAISLKTIPITFELPNGYAIFQRESFEGGYATTISVGKEVSSGHFNYAPLGMEFLATAYDTQLKREYSPKEYVDVVFNEQKKDSVSNPQYIQLFGNKAVSYANAVDGSITIVGYLRTDQLPELSHEYLVRISSFTYGSDVGIDKEPFDTVVNSLRVSK
ncbi:hypothetical protein A3E96_04070 [Candidatus Uhrbacteria bacterium RIFCSPHIGHO2_12_FULL_46_13]|nr:MAG: hypothetical protein A3E96_04070 [Candidatus Uhrbacteria bacterium RIFCSPHIGHO2_12_FULL_46_13]